MAKLDTQEVPFTQIANAVLNDKKLTWRAKGIFAYLFSKPVKWDFSALRIMEDGADGKAAVKSGLQELEEHDYLRRVRLSTGRVEYLLKYDKKPKAENRLVEPKAKSRKSHSGEIGLVSNKDKESNKENTNTAGTSPAGGSGVPIKRDSEPMTLADFIASCRKSPQRHINLIAEFADDIRPEYTTRGQWVQFIRRNVRPARNLAPYTDDQLSGAMGRLEKDLKVNGGFMRKFTMETIEKYLD